MQVGRVRQAAGDTVQDMLNPGSYKLRDHPVFKSTQVSMLCSFSSISTCRRLFGQVYCSPARYRFETLRDPFENLFQLYPQLSRAFLPWLFPELSASREREDQYHVFALHFA